MDENEIDTPAPASAPAVEDDFSGVDTAAIDAALGIAPEEQKPVPLDSGPVATPVPAVAAEGDRSAPPVATTAAGAPTTAQSTEPADIPVEKLLAILTQKKRVTEELDGDRAKLATERAELEAARKELQDSRTLLDLARRNPLQFAKEVLKTDPEAYARDLYLSHKGTSPQDVQRQRTVESEVEQLKQTVRSYEERINQEYTQRENERLVNQYKAEAKEAISKHDQKASPWVSRAFSKNPDKVMAQLVGLASHVAQSGAEVPKPQDLIPILEAGMVEQFGKYDFGEAKPVTTTTTLNASLSAAPRRAPVAAPDDEDIDERIVRGIKSGEHLRE